MTDQAGTQPDNVQRANNLSVWGDGTWSLVRHDAGTRLGLTLEHCNREGLGQLSDDDASQMGRIGNRLIRIIENLPEAGRVELARPAGRHVQLTFEVDGLDAEHLPEIATKLANWGGIASVSV